MAQEEEGALGVWATYIVCSVGMCACCLGTSYNSFLACPFNQPVATRRQVARLRRT